MPKYTCKALLLTNQVLPDGIQFSKEALKKLAAEESTNIPITVMFNPNAVVGKVEGLHATNAGLEADCSFIEGLQNAVIGAYAVPSGYLIDSHREGDIRVIDNFKLTSVGLVDIPSDSNLTPIVQIEEKS